MKPTLVAGTAFSRSYPVDAERCIAFMGDEGRVYATPSMVRDVETACRDFLLGHLDAGEDSVGSRDEIDHLAATPIGFTVTVEGTVVAVEGNAVTIDVVVRDALEQVGRGRHRRLVVDVARTRERLAAKRSKAGL